MSIWAVEAGAEEAPAREGSKSGRCDQWVVNATDQMSKDGVNGTPTVLVDGKMVEGTRPTRWRSCSRHSPLRDVSVIARPR